MPITYGVRERMYNHMAVSSKKRVIETNEKGIKSLGWDLVVIYSK